MSEETPFIWAGPNSAKVKCRVCGRTGWGELNPTLRTCEGWQYACLQGHPLECSCGRKFATGQAIASHRRKTGCTIPNVRSNPTT